MSPRTPYLLTCLALAGLAALALTGDPVAVISVVGVALLAVTVLAWEAAHR